MASTTVYSVTITMKMEYWSFMDYRSTTTSLLVLKILNALSMTMPSLEKAVKG